LGSSTAPINFINFIDKGVIKYEITKVTINGVIKLLYSGEIILGARNKKLSEIIYNDQSKYILDTTAKVKNGYTNCFCVLINFDDIRFKHKNIHVIKTGIAYKLLGDDNIFSPFGIEYQSGISSGAKGSFNQTNT